MVSLKAFGNLFLKISYNLVNKHGPSFIGVGHSHVTISPIVSNCAHRYSENLGLT